MARLISTDGSERAQTWRPYGDATMTHGDTGETIRLVRRASRCRWLADDGRIVSEQANVAPAICWAMVNGYFDPAMARAGIFTPRYEQYAPGKYREVA